MRHPSFAGILLSLALAAPAAAGEARFYLAPYGCLSSLTGEARVSDGTAGTDLDLEDTLGVEPRETALGVDGFVKILGSRIGFGYVVSDHSGDETLAGTVDFHGATFAAGERVRTDLELKRYQLMYGYDFSLKVVNVGFLVGLHALDLSARLRSTTTGVEASEDLRGVVPAVGISLGIHPIPRLAIHAEASGLSLTLSGVKVSLIDGFAGIDWLFIPKFGLKAGYRHYVLDAEDDDENDALHLNQSGPFAGLALHL